MKHFLLLYLCFSLTAAQALFAGDICKEHWKNKAVRDPKDPCAEAYMYQTAADLQTTTAYLYGAASAACAFACGWFLGNVPGSDNICKPFGLIAGAYDTVAIDEIRKAAKEVSKRTDNFQLISFGVGAAATFFGAGNFALALANTATTAATDTVRTGFDAASNITSPNGTQNQAAQSQNGEAAGSGNNLGTPSADNACLMMVAYGAVSFYRSFMQVDFETKAKMARNQKKMVMSMEAYNRALGDYAGQSGKTFKLSKPQDPRAIDPRTGNPIAESNFDDVLTEQEKTDRAKSLEATAIQISNQSKEYNPLKEFEKLSGKTSLDLFKKVASLPTGKKQNALLTTAGFVEDKLGKRGMAMLDKLSKELDAKMPDKIKEFEATQKSTLANDEEYEEREYTEIDKNGKTVVKKGKFKKGSLAGFGMKGLKLGQRPALGARGTFSFRAHSEKAVGEASLPAPLMGISNEKETEAFHPATASLFAVVSERYSGISKPFLEGDSLVAQLPENDERSPASAPAQNNSGFESSVGNLYSAPVPSSR